MSEHTAGPWKIDKAARALRNAGTVEINAHDWDALAVVYVRTVCEPSSEGEANARLIAAAPDLLESLQNIAEYWNQDQNEAAMADACWHAIHTARAAIAKATGEQP